MVAPAIAKTRKGTRNEAMMSALHEGSGDIAEMVAHSLVGKLKSDPRGGWVR